MQISSTRPAAARFGAPRPNSELNQAVQDAADAFAKWGESKSFDRAALRAVNAILSAGRTPRVKTDQRLIDLLALIDKIPEEERSNKLQNIAERARQGLERLRKNASKNGNAATIVQLMEDAFTKMMRQIAQALGQVAR